MKVKKKRKTDKELQHFQAMKLSDNDSKKGVSSVAESVESGLIMSYSSKWNLGSDELFATWLNENNKNQIEKPINYFLDLLIHTSLNHMSIRSHLISESKNKLISSIEHLFNATYLSPITFGIIFSPNQRS